MRRAPIVGMVVLAVVASTVPARAVNKPYTQPIYGVLTTNELDVLVVPPTHGPLFNDEGVLNGNADPMQATPFNVYIDAIRDSIQMWTDAVRAKGPRWLRKVMKVRTYVLGVDNVPPEAFQEPEIVITTAEFNGAGGWAVWGSSPPCVISNSMFVVQSFTYKDMFNVNAQEYGHCLGLAHIQVDGTDQGAYEHPLVGHDTMTGLYAHQIGSKDVHFHCISNLNMSGLEAVFAPFAPRSVKPRFPSAVSDRGYRKVYCPRPSK